MLNDPCRDRLLNFKFMQALQYVDDDATPRERDLIFALSHTFGDPGWFDGLMSVVVRAALKSIGV